MTAYVLMAVTTQEEFTEPRYYASAQEHVDIIGIYISREAAEKKKFELLTIPKNEEDPHIEYHIMEKEVV